MVAVHLLEVYIDHKQYMVFIVFMGLDVSNFMGRFTCNTRKILLLMLVPRLEVDADACGIAQQCIDPRPEASRWWVFLLS